MLLFAPRASGGTFARLERTHSIAHGCRHRCSQSSTLTASGKCSVAWVLIHSAPSPSTTCWIASVAPNLQAAEYVSIPTTSAGPIVAT